MKTNTPRDPPVVIGLDPHKRSVTIEVLAADGTVLARGRFGTDPAGYRTMLDDLANAAGTGPGGQQDDDSDSSATGSQPHTGSSDHPLPRPVPTQPSTARHPPPDMERTQ